MDLIPTMPGIELDAQDLPDGAPVDPADGHIAFEGLPNTRDLGYLHTADRRRIKPHLLLRSGALAAATERDATALVDEFGVRTVIDLRTEEERAKSPDPESEMPGVRFVDVPILDTRELGITREGGIRGLLAAAKALEQDPAQIMRDLYPKMLLDEESRQGYAAFFDQLLQADQGAVLWHCSAGKDRAGLAAVLLEHVLGVPQDAIERDYLATNRYMASRTEEVLDALAAHHIAGKLGSRLDESVRVLNSADLSFLHAALDAVTAAYGSLDAYVSEGLGVTAEKQEALKQRYLTAA